MIKESQEKYLASLPDGKVIEVKPFDPRVREVAESLMAQIKEALPDADLHFGGAAALEIAGQNDIDISILYDPADFDHYLSTLEKLFGKPSRTGTSPKNKSVKWEFKKDGFEVELYISLKSSPVSQEQIKVFELLSKNEGLRDAYEQTKLPYGQIDFKEYVRKKYEFFNKILEDNPSEEGQKQD
ncbi:MAG: GrpB family protein [Candidatus Yanofskybacteria bacterium]|nr:GrpB family protein [Candidatus Yanofskybacteria bacterium]